ncbi:ATP phosphoribosyltransferase regulatory subunit [Pelagibacteraceae bacterium]|jgi:ATP phosphoribosyltransferase regulatory subunit|nr:ATP phosphoribosyltransferase regulatory subunit [Pelagibacteraceae bacterium]
MKSKKYSEALLNLFKKKGFKVKEFENIIESKIIIERSGEIFKKSLLSFEDDNGKNFSLRPDLTISACLDYIKNVKKGIYKYAYFDQAYRRTFSKESLVRNQLGCEIIGSSNLKLNTEIINLIDQSLKKVIKDKTIIKINDINIFYSLVDSLQLPSRWRLRLKRHFWRPDYFNELISRLESNSDLQKNVFELDKKSYIKMKKLKQNKKIAGRKINEILNRFEKKIKEPRSNIKGLRVARIIRDFLKIDCPFKNAKNVLKKFEIDNKINLKLNQFDVFDFEFKNNNTIFSSNIGRGAEYYTGLVFEIYKKSKNLNLASGGRYDNLMQTLGAKTKIAAIGGAINYDNILKL